VQEAPVDSCSLYVLGCAAGTGEYCPPGTQEETKFSLAACQLQPMGSGPGSQQGSSNPDNSLDQLGHATAADACKGFKPCPEGKFCPDASAAMPCETGRWCPVGSVASQSCNMAVRFNRDHGQAGQGPYCRKMGQLGMRWSQNAVAGLRRERVSNGVTYCRLLYCRHCTASPE
jgi:hypothetical protein